MKGLSVVYDTEEAYWAGPVVDASRTGMFVETTHELEKGTRVILMLDGWDNERLPFDIAAEAVRVHELDWDEHYDRIPGIAFRFTDLSPEAAEALGVFLSKHGEAVTEC